MGAIVEVLCGEALFVEMEVVALNLPCGEETVIQGGVDGSDSADVRLPLQGAHKVTKRREGSDDRLVTTLSKGFRQENQRAVLGTAWTPTYTIVSYPCDNCAPLLWG